MANERFGGTSDGIAGFIDEIITALEIGDSAQAMQHTEFLIADLRRELRPIYDRSKGMEHAPPVYGAESLGGLERVGKLSRKIEQASRAMIREPHTALTLLKTARESWLND